MCELVDWDARDGEGVAVRLGCGELLTCNDRIRSARRLGGTLWLGCTWDRRRGGQTNDGQHDVKSG